MKEFKYGWMDGWKHGCMFGRRDKRIDRLKEGRLAGDTYNRKYVMTNCVCSSHGVSMETNFTTCLTDVKIGVV